MFKTLSSLVAVVAIGSGIAVTYILHQVPDPPDIDLDRWWGIGTKPNEQDTSIRHFAIDFNDTMINDLKQRLRNRRPFTKPLEGTQSQYGMNTVYLEKILTYWSETYDFKKRAELLNRFPHYKTRVQGLDIHFVRVKPDLKGASNVKVLPLLIMHGWPSSSKEFDKVIPIYTTPRKGYDFVFEIIAPDLPGFGFSEGTTKPGLSPVHIGVVMRNLMKRLGYDQYYIQAGDWGAQTATHMVTLFQDVVLGFHTNFPMSSMPRSVVKLIAGALFPRLVDKHWDRVYPLKDFASYMMRETGYFHLQATKPDTISVALTDSPAALAGYTIEKMAVASNRDQLDTDHGGIESIPLDDVLDTLTIVWANNCIATATRIYKEAFGIGYGEISVLQNTPTKVPAAVTNFKHELIYQPEWILRDKFTNLVRVTAHDFGGHFAALQTPQVLADDVFDATVEFLKFHEKNVKK